ncbi:MAG: hypothetical protein QM764_20555 [Chitinophagaceae bacterium]
MRVATADPQFIFLGTYGYALPSLLYNKGIDSFRPFGNISLGKNNINGSRLPDRTEGRYDY